ncbi:ScyD/ScyE family protein [Arthrobacter sp. UYCu712]|uniref:ScyD/ScyE family protein n=1 Tax=Arthrobacter sp. UYCu712 TaxID=3156340 RepID=UPI0033981F35
MRKQLSSLAVAATAALLLATGPPRADAPDGSSAGGYAGASARSPAGIPAVRLAAGLVGPLHVSAGRDGSVTVSEQFASRLTRIDADGSRKVLYENNGWDVAGNTQEGSTTYVVESQGAGRGDNRELAAHVRIIEEDGDQRTIGDFAALEKKDNADGGARYGFRDLPADCASKLPPELPASYTGELNTRPYGIAVSDGTVFAADAGANTVVSVNIRSGKAKTVAVLPPRPSRITAAAAAGLHLPQCVVGRSYAFEPVPTDVAVGPDGWLYVSTMPGGPESPGADARGAVFKIDPEHGKVKLLAESILSPTGIAVTSDGDVYVASLFGDGVIKLDGRTGKPSVALASASTADVVLRGSTLYATVNSLPSDPAPPNGQVATLKLGRDSRDSDDSDDS